MKWITLALVSVLALGLAAWMLLPNEATPIPVEVTPTAADATPDRTESHAASDSDAAASPGAESNNGEIEEPAQGIHGRVFLRDTGEPVAGVVIHLGLERHSPGALPGGVSDEAGEFFISLDAHRTYKFFAIHSTYVSEEPFFEATISEDSPSPRFEIALEEGGVISGQVYERATNVGIPRVQLILWHGLGTYTDENGRYSFTGLPRGEQKISIGDALGYQGSGATRSVTVTPGEVISTVDFVLTREVYGIISGRVVDSDGNGFAGATVKAMNHGRSSSPAMRIAETLDDGSFRLEELPVGDSFYVVAEAEKLVSETAGPLGLTVDGIHGVELKICPLGSIAGRILDSNTGKPITDPTFLVNMRHSQYGKMEYGPSRATPDHNGRFFISDLRPTTYELILVPFPPHSFNWEAQVTIELEPGQAVTGVELTYDYAGLEDAKAEDKAFYEAMNKAYQEFEKPIVGEIRGQVLNAVNREPLSEFTLRGWGIYFGDGHSGSKSFHSDEGRFVLEEQRDSSLRFEVLAKGYVTQEVTVEGGPAPRPAENITIAMQPGSLVNGTVNDSSGAPIAGARIFIGVDPDTIANSGMGPDPDAITGPDGAFRLDTFPPTHSRTFAEHAAFATGTGEVTAKSSGSLQVAIVLTEGGVVQGTVRQAGQPVPGNGMYFMNEEGYNVHFGTMKTNAKGEYRISHIPPGHYRIGTFLGKTNRSQERWIEILEGAPAKADFNFDETENTFEGVIRLNGGTPTNIYITAVVTSSYGKESLSYSARDTDSFCLKNLPIGEAHISINVSDSDWNNTTTNLDLLVEGGTIRKDFALSSGI